MHFVWCEDCLFAQKNLGKRVYPAKGPGRRSLKNTPLNKYGRVTSIMRTKTFYYRLYSRNCPPRLGPEALPTSIYDKFCAHKITIFEAELIT